MLNPGSSLNVGSRAYSRPTTSRVDTRRSVGAGTNIDESASDPQVVFDSIYDDTSTATSTLVPTPINVTGEATTPTLGPSMWGGIGIQSGAAAVINAATFEYGGGAINTPNFTIPSQSVLAFITLDTDFPLPPAAVPTLGSHVYITNNNFFNNFDAAMQIEPNGLLAGDPLDPLVSGHPFFRGNVMQDNGIDGLLVITNRGYPFVAASGYNYVGPVDGAGGTTYANQSVSTVWDATDLTYVLEGTIIASGPYFPGFGGNFLGTNAPVPSQTAYGPIPNPVVCLTIQVRPARDAAGRRHDDSEPRPVGHRQDAQRVDTARRRCRQPVDDLRVDRGRGVRGRRRRVCVRSRGRRGSDSEPARRSRCLLRAADPGNSGQPDDRAAAGAGDHDLAPRRYGRYDGARDCDGRHLEQSAGGGRDCGLRRPQLCRPESDDACSGGRRLHLHRRAVAHGVRPHRSVGGKLSSATPTSAT